jgi:hypothetical protein
MINKYAVITDGVVTNIVISQSKLESNWVKTDDASIGDLYEVGVFTSVPKEQVEPPIRKITIGAFRRRLTVAEKVAINTSVDPVVQVLKEDLASSQYVELDFQGLIDSLNYLVSQGILEASRLPDLLKDGVEEEKP